MVLQGDRIDDARIEWILTESRLFSAQTLNEDDVSDESIIFLRSAPTALRKSYGVRMVYEGVMQRIKEPHNCGVGIIHSSWDVGS